MTDPAAALASLPDMFDLRADRYRAAAAALSDAHARYAEAWLMFRTRAKSDLQATHQATVEWGDEITRLTAELEIARRALDRG